MPGSPILCVVEVKSAKTINEVASQAEAYGQLRALVDHEYGIT
jgi:hypothetical protein